jgi:DNA-binding MarR family transcriptional regulator
MSLFYNYRDMPYQFQDEIKATEIETGLAKRTKTRRAGRFLKGPIPLLDMATASRLPGRSLALFLAVHHQIALTGTDAVTVPSKLLSDLGISRSTKARCLKLLERAGLVTVTRLKGRAVRIQLKNRNIGDNNDDAYPG